ncbi:MAG: tetratricopeptide repeat protein [Gammaproteobacteria bacterium]|nr:tetratricopeptide repeat protein [Gammaproteobacteria bacterium]
MNADANTQAKQTVSRFHKSIKLARSYTQKNDFDKALRTYELVIKDSPEDAVAFLGMGRTYMKMGNYEAAEKYFNGALHLNDQMAQAMIMLAALSHKQGNEDKALALYQEALNINPKLTKVRVAVSGIYVKRKMFIEAENILKEALRYNPQYSEARLMLSKVLHKQGQNSKALESLDRLLEREPDSWVAYFLRGRFLSESDSNMAIEAFKQSIQLKPDNAIAYFYLGEVYMLTEHFEHAVLSFAEVENIKSEMDQVMVSCKLAKAYSKMGAYKEAEKVLHKLSLGEKRLGMIHFMLAEVYVQQEKYHLAVEEYEAGSLHAQEFLEKHPEFQVIQEQNISDDKKARGYAEIVSGFISEAEAEAAASAELNAANEGEIEDD